MTKKKSTESTKSTSRSSGKPTVQGKAKSSKKRSQKRISKGDTPTKTAVNSMPRDSIWNLDLDRTKHYEEVKPNVIKKLWQKVKK